MYKNDDTAVVFFSPPVDNRLLIRYTTPMTQWIAGYPNRTVTITADTAKDAEDKAMETFGTPPTYITAKDD